MRRARSLVDGELGRSQAGRVKVGLGTRDLDGRRWQSQKAGDPCVYFLPTGNTKEESGARYKYGRDGGIPPVTI